MQFAADVARTATVPFGHGRHAVRGAFGYRPAEHWVHTAAPAEDLQFEDTDQHEVRCFAVPSEPSAEHLRNRSGVAINASSQ